MPKIILPPPRVGKCYLKVYDGTGFLWQNAKTRNLRLKLPKQLEGKKRGKIKGFSFASAHRLRMLLLSCDYSKPAVGATFTSPPWATRSPEEAWRILQHNLKRIPDILSQVWRKEITAKGLSHYHAIVFGDSVSVVGGVWESFEMWSHYLMPRLDRSKIEEYLRQEEKILKQAEERKARGEKVPKRERGHPNKVARFREYLSAPDDVALKLFRSEIFKNHTEKGGLDVHPFFAHSDAALRYICDHSSKHKAYQAKTSGKAWGVVNRASLPVRVVSSTYAFEVEYEAKMNRFLRKLSMKPQRADCVFGSRRWWARSFRHGSKVAFGAAAAAAADRYARYLSDCVSLAGCRV